LAKKNVLKGSNFSKIQDFYNNSAHKVNKTKFKFKNMYKPLEAELLNPLMVYTSDFFNNPKYSNILNFNYYNNDSLLESIDDSYENIKNYKYIYHKLNQNLVSNSLSFLPPISYSSV
jgi:hypothetical protein